MEPGKESEESFCTRPENLILLGHTTDPQCTHWLHVCGSKYSYVKVLNNQGKGLQLKLAVYVGEKFPHENA